jgi:hypothetical protein
MDENLMDEDSEDEFGEAGALTPTSSTTTSPAGQTFVDVRVGSSRLPSSVAGESSIPGRLNPRRSRSCLNSGHATSSTMPSQLAHELPYRLLTGMPKFEGQMDGGIPADVAMPEHRDSLHQAAEESALAARMGQQVPSNVYERDLEAHFGARDMMHVLPSYDGPCHHGGGAAHAWMGMMPNMGPEPPDHVFGIHPRMTTAHQDLGNSLFGSPADEMGNQPGLPLMGGMHYHDFGDSHRQALPFRGMDTSHHGMLPPDDGMNLGTGAYFQL